MRSGGQSGMVVKMQKRINGRGVGQDLKKR
jgi:hypothetical protein